MGGRVYICLCWYIFYIAHFSSLNQSLKCFLMHRCVHFSMTSQCGTVRPLNKNSPTCSLLTLASWRESHLLSDHKWGWQVRSLYCYKTHQSWRWMQAAWVKHCSATNKQMNKKYFVSSLSLPVIFCITYTHKNLQDKISSWLKVTFYHNLQLNGLSTVLQICTISSIPGP